LHTAAHEAAHVIQQRNGVRLPGGIDHPGDRHEQHADLVADRVVRGESVEELLDAQGVQPRGPSENVQRKVTGITSVRDVIARAQSEESRARLISELGKARAADAAVTILGGPIEYSLEEALEVFEGDLEELKLKDDLATKPAVAIPDIEIDTVKGP